MVAVKGDDGYADPTGNTEHEQLVEKNTVAPVTDGACSILTSTGEVRSSGTTNYRNGRDAHLDAKLSTASERLPRREIKRPTLRIQHILPILAKAAMVSDPPAKSPRQVKIPAGQLRAWTGSQSVNTFRVSTHDGYCVVKASLDHDRDDMRILALEGSEEGQTQAMSMIMSGVSLSDSTSDDHYAKSLRRMRHVRVEELPKPQRWTTRAFLLYVDAVTGCQRAGSINRVLYPRPGPSYVHTAAAILRRLFWDDDTKQYISTAALRLALRFCRRNPRIARAVSEICEGSIAAGIVPDIQCFNEELNRVMSTKSTRLTQHLLQAVLQQRVPFNSTTWKLIMGHIQDLPLQQQILEVVEQQGFLDAARSRQEIAAAWCNKIFRSIRHEPGALEELVGHMKEVFGADWISPTAVTNIIKAGCVVPRNATLSKNVLKFVLEAQSAGVPVTDEGLEALLRLLNQPKDSATVLSMLRSQYRCFDLLRRSPQVTTRIFVLAWKTRRLNLCRLVWHCAAASGNITHQMVAMLMDSATINIRQGGSETYRVWYLIAGKLILGTHLDAAGFTQLFPALSSTSFGQDHALDLDPRTSLLFSTDDNSIQEEQTMLVRLLVERDLHAWRRFEPLSHDVFRDLLDHAIHLDQTCHHREAIANVQPSQLLQSVIGIPLTPRDKQIRVQHPELDLYSNNYDSRKWLHLGKWLIDKDDLTWSGTRLKDAETAPQNAATTSHATATDSTEHPLDLATQRRTTDAST